MFVRLFSLPLMHIALVGTNAINNKHYTNNLINNPIYEKTYRIDTHGNSRCR